MILNVTKYRPIDFKPKFQIFQLVCDWGGILYCFSAAFTDVLWTLFTGDSGDSAVPVALLVSSALLLNPSQRDSETYSPLTAPWGQKENISLKM